METVGYRNHSASGRISGFDVAKCVGMWLVCTCHCYYATIRNQSQLNLAVVSVAMPLFMTICGFFAHSTLNSGLRMLVTRRLLPLALPIIACTVCFAALSVAWHTFSVATLLETAMGCLWFLRALAVIYVVAWLVLRLPLPQWLSALISVVVLLAVPGGSAWQVNYLIILFWTGFFLRKHYQSFCRHLSWVAQASVGVYIIGALTGFVHGQYHFSHWMITNFPFALIAQVVVGVSGSLAVISLSHLLCRITVHRRYLGHVTGAMATIGRYTLGIYLVQTVLLQYVGYHYAIPALMQWAGSLPLWLADFVLTPLLALLAMLLCYAITRLLARNSHLSFALFGTTYAR